MQGYLRTTAKGTAVVKTPLVSICFEGDGRTFSSADGASSRVEVVLEYIARGRELRAVADRVRIGETSKVDCDTGEVLATARAGAESVSIGSIKKTNWRSVQFIDVTSANPFVGTPSIDAEIVVGYDGLSRKFDVRGSVGAFPAFEMYAQVGSRPIQRLFALKPASDASVLELFDLNLGLNGVQVSGELDGF